MKIVIQKSLKNRGKGNWLERKGRIILEGLNFFNNVINEKISGWYMEMV